MPGSPREGTKGKASRYPLTLEVAGLEGTLDSVSVRLLGLHHANPEDLDVWLVAPDGTTVTLLSDVGGDDAVDGESVLILDGAAPAGRSRFDAQVGPFDREADEQRKGAAPPADLSVLQGIEPNGVWQLQIADDHVGGTGHLDAWSLQIR